MPAQRPGPIRWLRYALGGRLGEPYREWVLYDLTRPTWLPRHLGRAAVQHSPWALLLLVPFPSGVGPSVLAVAWSMALLLSLMFAEDACERRITKHGYPPGLGRLIREETRASDRARVVAGYAARYRGDAREDG